MHVRGIKIKFSPLIVSLGEFITILGNKMLHTKKKYENDYDERERDGRKRNLIARKRFMLSNYS